MTEPVKVGNNGDSEFVFPNPQKVSIRVALQAMFDAITSLTNAVERLEKKIEAIGKEIK